MRYILYTTFSLFFIISAFSQKNVLKNLQVKAKAAFTKADYDSAVWYATKLTDEAIKEDSIKYQIRAEFLKGNIYSEQDKTKQAFEHYFSGLKLAKKANDLEIQGNFLNRLGALYYSQKSYDEAKKYFQEEIELKEKLQDTIRLANALINISMLYRRLKEPEAAEAVLLRVRKIVGEKQDSMLSANYYNAQATYYFGRFTIENKIAETSNQGWNRSFALVNLRDSAELYWKKALDIWLGMGDAYAAVNPLFNLGYAYQTRNDLKGALKNYMAAKKIVDSLQKNSSRVTLYGNIAEVYYDMKDYKLSNDYFRKVIELKDSLQRVTVQEYTERLSKQYQMETNRTIVQQELELSQKNSEIDNQKKKIYIYVLLFVLLVFIIIGILFYINFNKRVNKRIEEAKEKFFANIMHEIRTPLSMIQAPLKTLKPKLNDEESKYYINLAEKNVVRLNELINQMLDISKMENANYKLVNTVGNLDLFLMELSASYEKLATEKNINFISEINYQNTLLVFDKDALEKIISNLLSNAIKYTPANGSVGLTVNIEDGEHEAKLLIDVWDTGIGIAKNEQDKVFDRFFRSEKSINKASGVGIGLSLVKDLVTAYRGTISFVSEENKGTKFSVELKLKHPEQAESTSETVKLESNNPVILLVEDDKDIIDFTGSFLKSKELEIVKAKNGNLAKTLLKNITPDLIVTDLMMDELDGLSFIKEIKTNKGLNHIPIIVLSAKSAGQTRIEVLNAGAQAFLSKPFLPDELYSVISNQLELIARIKSELKVKIETQKPDQTAEEKFNSTEPYTQKLFDLIFKNLDNSDLSVELLADLMATNRSHFQRKIKNLTGYSPSELIKMIRLEKSKEFLLAKRGNITEVAYMCGFSSQSYFTKCFTQQFGYSPTQIHNQ